MSLHVYNRMPVLEQLGKRKYRKGQERKIRKGMGRQQKKRRREDKKKGEER